MLNIKQILVPTDFSAPSESALVYAKDFAETFKATLHLLHVVEDMPVYPWASPEGLMPLPMPAREEIEKGAREQLDRLVSSADRQRFSVHVVTESGSPFVEIVRYAKAKNIDLIVIGTHGRGPIAHMLMGSVAEKVVRKAPCPVLTVRPAKHEFKLP